MTKEIRIFEKQEDGRLLEVARANLGTRRFSRVNLDVDVLWTAEEEKQRDEEEARFTAEAAAAATAAKEAAEAEDQKQQDVRSAADKLKDFLTANPDVVSMISDSAQ